MANKENEHMVCLKVKNELYDEFYKVAEYLTPLGERINVGEHVREGMRMLIEKWGGKL